MTMHPLGKLQQRSVKADTLAPTATSHLGHAPAGIPAQGIVHGKRRRGSGEIVQQTVRLRRADWQRMSELRVKEGWSAQEQFIMGLGLLFAQCGMAPPESPVATGPGGGE